MKIVVNKNLILRKYNNKDKLALYENSRDPLFTKYLEYKKFSKNQFNLWLKKKLKIKNEIFFVIEYEKKAIGTYLLNITGIRNQNCNLGYGISTKYTGQKIFTKVTRKILERFQNIKKFSAITRDDNLASIKGLKRLKFRKEGELKSYYYDLKTEKYYNAVILSYVRNK
tara:strand:+ start:4016 stop:4522 length:507 start_codon:yes stop_codon:yes gene_type:complete